jgi:hypothetical protein
MPRPKVLGKGSVKLQFLPHKKAEPLWKGPMDDSPMGGITQSMLGRFLVCRERFRLHYIEGLQPIPKFQSAIEVGNMWHACEEALARVDVKHMKGDYRPWEEPLLAYAKLTAAKYANDGKDVEKWYLWVKHMFPEYVAYWNTHKDVVNRTPLMQEQVFHVPYTLPSGRVVYLKGKYDAVDLIKDSQRGPGIYLQENKTKGDLDQPKITRQLGFDLQTMMYLLALSIEMKIMDAGSAPIRGVRYNCVWRNMPIRRHKEKVTVKKLKSGDVRTVVPEETWDHYWERFLNEYVRDEPQLWFKRWQVDVTPADVRKFQTKCLDPILEQLCTWYEWITQSGDDVLNCIGPHWVHPHGVYNALNEGGSTDVDEHIYTGSLVGLRKVNTLFEELQ